MCVRVFVFEAGEAIIVYGCTSHSTDQMRAYFTQLRQEIGGRLVEKVFGSEPKPSKVCFVATSGTYMHV